MIDWSLTEKLIWLAEHLFGAFLALGIAALIGAAAGLALRQLVNLPKRARPSDKRS